MKKIIFVILLYFVVCYTSNAQLNDLTKLELKGSVKYLSEISKFNDSSKMILDELEYFFNQEGSVVEKKDFNKKQLTQCNYGNKNELIKTTIYNFNKEMIVYTEFEYNKNDKMKGYKACNKNNKLLYSVTFEYSINSNNNIEIIEIKIDSSNIFISKSKETLNSENKVIYRINYNSDNSIENEFKYNIDSTGIAIGYNKFNSTGENEWNVKNIYNSKNHLIKKILTNNAPILILNWSFDYVFDIEENWTKKVFKKDNRTVKITERKIEYY